MKTKLLYINILLFCTVSIWGCTRTQNEADKSSKNQVKGECSTQVGAGEDCGKAVSNTTGKDEGIKVTFVEIGSVRCIPCKMMQPIMKEIEKEYSGQVKIVFHDVWTEQGKADAAKYKHRVIPTQVFLDKDGNEYYRHKGFFPKEEIVKVLKMKGVE